jgi:hypothetical protein
MTRSRPMRFITLLTLAICGAPGRASAQEVPASREPATAPRDTEPAADSPAKREPRIRARARFDVDHADATLESRIDGERDDWLTLCTGPCDVEADPEHQYRVAGPGIRASRPFQLPRDRANVTITPEIGTTGRQTAGGVLAIGGGSLALVGLPTLLAGLLLRGVSADSTTTESEAQDVRETGTTVAVVGGVMLVGGLVAGVVGLNMLLDSRTTVKVSRRSDGSLYVPFASGVAFEPRGFVF